MDTQGVSAGVALGLLGVVFSWWAVKEGAYFGTVLLPGLMLLTAGLAILLRSAPWRGMLSLSRPVTLALTGILGLAAWSALSALWSPSPDVALADAQRIAGYGLCFGLGLWLCNLLGPRMHLAMAPVAIAAGVAGLVAVGAMLMGNEIVSYLEGDGTLQHPLGYRNANAAFFMVAVWPALGLARARDLGPVWRAAALGVATLAIEMALFSQSRGAVLAAAVALGLYFVLSKDRARAAAWLGLAVVPALVVLPALTDLYSAANNGSLEAAIPQMRAAGRAALAGLALAVAAGLIATRLDARFSIAPEREARADRVVGMALLAGLAAGALAFVVLVGNPVDFIEQRVEQFRTEGSPGFEGEASRFTFDTGTERLDLWEVALDETGSDPLFGTGAGGFQYSYTLNRQNPNQNARDAHSVELEVLSELGLPGLALLGVGFGAAVVGARRSRRLGPGPAALSAAALTSAGYWLAHSSIDWFWTYPVVTGPVLMLLGAACAPGILAPRQRRGAGRRWTFVAVVVFAATLIPPFLSERYTNHASDSWRLDPARAYADLDRARTLNPLSEEPWLVEGAIAREAGVGGRAIEAFRGATSERPAEWAAHYFLALAYLDEGDRASARRALDVALGLNPGSARLERLDSRLGGQVG